MTAGDSVEPTFLGSGWRHRKVVGAWILVAAVIGTASLMIGKNLHGGGLSLGGQPPSHHFGLSSHHSLETGSGELCRVVLAIARSELGVGEPSSVEELGLSAGG
jgi:hypothetical protein